MKILMIGGTGTISSAISRELLANGHELYLVNRGNRNIGLKGNVHFLTADINQENTIAALIQGIHFDAVADFIAFKPEDLQRDYRLFSGKTDQFIFISSASAYQKPSAHYVMNESTPLSNPYWQYSRDKIACEEYLTQLYRKEQFPVTIVRPSHTYGETKVTVGLHGKHGSWQVLKRILDGKPVIIHGDGTSLWTVTHNTDFARAFIGLLGNIHAIGETVQITSDESLTWNQIYSIIGRALQKPDFEKVYVPSDILASTSRYDFEGALLGDKAGSIVFDNSKLKRLVPGFAAVKRADQGITEAVRYALSHPECQIEDPEFDLWCDRVCEIMKQAKSAIAAV